jgi:hypothetical protein
MEKPTTDISDKDNEILRLARKIESLTNPSKDTEDID